MLLHPANIIIMTSRPWRLCPDLDAYPDEQCKAFLDRAVRSRYAGIVATMTVAFLIGLAVFVGLSIAVENLTGIHSVWRDVDVWQGRLRALSQAALMFLVVGVLAPVPYIRLLRYGVREVLDRAKCKECGYSLQGLTVADDQVRCPECGTTIALGTLGLTSDSIALGRPLPNGVLEHITTPQRWEAGIKWARLGVGALAAWLVIGWHILFLAAFVLFMMAAFDAGFRAYATDQNKPG